MQRSILTVIAFAVLTVTASAAFGNDAYTDPANDENYFGAASDLFNWTPRQQIAGYRNIEKISPARLIPASTSPMTLPRAEQDLGSTEISGVFDEQPFSLTVSEFFERQRVAGLLVIHDGAIVYEKYGLGNDETSRWNGFSVAKSVVSLLYGAALRDGYINSVDDSVTEYLPRLRNSSYDQASIRNLLHMASGVAWNEDYSDPESDISTANWETLSLYNFLAAKPRVAVPGETFNYNTAESNLAGSLLRSAIGNNLSTYLHHRIWEPFGMESDAYWILTEEGGGEFGGCCLAATLRDFGRIGLFALNAGMLADGTQVLGEGWMDESTTPSPGADFYGYLWWLRKGDAFQAAGIYGQGIYIDPASNIVIAIQSALKDASNRKDWAMQRAMFESIAGSLE